MNSVRIWLIALLVTLSLGGGVAHAQSFLSRGDAAYEQGDLSTASTLYESTLRAGGLEGEMLERVALRLAVLRGATGDVNGALSMLRLALTLNPEAQALEETDRATLEAYARERQRLLGRQATLVVEDHASMSGGQGEIEVRVVDDVFTLIDSMTATINGREVVLQGARGSVAVTEADFAEGEARVELSGIVSGNVVVRRSFTVRSVASSPVQANSEPIRSLPAPATQLAQTPPNTSMRGDDTGLHVGLVLGGIAIVSVAVVLTVVLMPTRDQIGVPTIVR